MKKIKIRIEFEIYRSLVYGIMIQTEIWINSSVWRDELFIVDVFDKSKRF